jgi:hypothetical protein
MGVALVRAYQGDFDDLSVGMPLVADPALHAALALCVSHADSALGRAALGKLPFSERGAPRGGFKRLGRGLE